MYSPTTEPAPEHSTPMCSSPGSRALYREVADALHALAQPLTSSQARLELALYQAQTSADYRIAIEHALSDMQRAFDLMQYVRELNHLQEAPADAASVPVGDLVQEVAAELKCLLDTSGIIVRFRAQAPDACVFGSRSRLRQLFFYLLAALQSSCKPASLLAISVKQDAESVCLEAGVSVLTEQAGAEHEQESRCWLPTDPASRMFKLVEMMASSLGGRFFRTEGPSRVVVLLPGDQSDRA